MVSAFVFFFLISSPSSAYRICSQNKALGNLLKILNHDIVKASVFQHLLAIHWPVILVFSWNGIIAIVVMLFSVCQKTKNVHPVCLLKRRKLFIGPTSVYSCIYFGSSILIVCSLVYFLVLLAGRAYYHFSVELSSWTTCLVYFMHLKLHQAN